MAATTLTDTQHEILDRLSRGDAVSMATGHSFSAASALARMGLVHLRTEKCLIARTDPQSGARRDVASMTWWEARR